jgi:hypothetical protein
MRGDACLAGSAVKSNGGFGLLSSGINSAYGLS